LIPTGEHSIDALTFHRSVVANAPFRDGAGLPGLWLTGVFRYWASGAAAVETRPCTEFAVGRTAGRVPNTPGPSFDGTASPLNARTTGIPIGRLAHKDAITAHANLRGGTIVAARKTRSGNAEFAGGAGSRFIVGAPSSNPWDALARSALTRKSR